MTRKLSNFKNKNVLFPVILVSALSLVGWGVSVVVGNIIPLCLLSGFSVFYSIEKWLSYYTRRHKIVGKIYRLILNLSVLSLLSLLIWSGIALFSQRFMHSPLIGSLVFLAELAVFVWFCRVAAKNSWRQPSMKLTVFSSVCLFIIFAFAGLQPMAFYKDAAIGKITDFINEQQIKAEERATQERIEEEERLTTLGITNPNEVAEEVKTNKELRIGLEVVELVNAIREERGTPELVWDDNLYEYSLAHSKDMAGEDRLFHTSMNLPYAENVWGGQGSKSWGAETMVESWMNSNMHRTWLLCPRIKHVAVGIAYSSNGMYASWTFWRSETALSDWWYQYSPDNPPEWWY